MKRAARIVAAFALLLIGAGAAQAATTQGVDVKVSISANKSVLIVGATTYDFGALAVNTASNSATAIVVRNDSGALVQTYTVQGANAASIGGGTTWTLVASTGTLDQYTLAAQFSTARPDNDEANWSSDSLTTSAQSCSASQFGNGVSGESGTGVSPTVGQYDRNLWFRLVTPALVSDTTARQATVTIGVQ